MEARSDVNTVAGSVQPAFLKLESKLKILFLAVGLMLAGVVMADDPPGVPGPGGPVPCPNNCPHEPIPHPRYMDVMALATNPEAVHF
jgi:hypothetical protein